MILKINRQGTQEELAFRANMHPTAISFYERGMRQPTLYSVFVIAEVLAIKASALVAELEGVQAPASGFDELSQGKSGAAESDLE